MLVDERADELGGATVLRLDYGVANSDFCALFVLPATHSPNSLLAATKGLKACARSYRTRPRSACKSTSKKPTSAGAHTASRAKELLEIVRHRLQDLSISSLLLRQREQMVHLRLPRFRAEWGVASLKKALRELGLKV